MLQGTEVVEDILQHLGRGSVERVAVSAAARAIEHVHVSGLQPHSGELRRHLSALARIADIEQLDAPRGAFMTAENAPGHVLVTLVLVGDEAICQHALFLDASDAATVPACAGHDVVTQLVAIADHGQMDGQVLERVVARVGHQVVDAVGTVGARPPAIGTFVDLQEHPVVAAGPDAGVGDERETCGASRDDVVGQDGRQRLVDQVDHPVDLGEARFRGGGEFGVVDRSLWCKDVDRPERPLIGGHFDFRRLGIQEERSNGAEASHLRRSLERNVETGLNLVGGAREIDLDAVALHPHADLDGQAYSAVLAVVVQETLGMVFAIGDGRDALAQDAFGIVHELAGGGENRVLAVAIEEFPEAAYTQARRSDLGFQVGLQFVRRAAVAADVLPQGVVTLALLVELGAGEQHAFGIDVRNVDDQSRRGRPDVEVVGGVGGESDMLTLVEDGDDDGDVGRVAGAVVGMVVDHHVAVVPHATLQRLGDTFQVTGDGTDVERRRLRFAKRVELRVE